MYGKQFIQRKFGWKEIAFSITAFLFSSIIFHGGIENEYIAELLRLVMVISCWIIFELFLSLEIYWYMEITMFIYVFHRITQQCVNKILVLIINYIGISDCLGALLNTILGVIITIMLSIGIAFILINFCKPLWLILTGYRVPKKFR